MSRVIYHDLLFFCHRLSLNRCFEILMYLPVFNRNRKYLKNTIYFIIIYNIIHCTFSIQRTHFLRIRSPPGFRYVPNTHSVRFYFYLISYHRQSSRRIVISYASMRVWYYVGTHYYHIIIMVLKNELTKFLIRF